MEMTAAAGVNACSRGRATANSLSFGFADALPSRFVGQARLLIATEPLSLAKPGLLFVHGAHHGAWCFAQYLEFFACGGLACSAIDLRGHGPLPQSDTYVNTSVADLANDVLGALDTLNRPTILVGHSLGALVALIAAAHRHVVGIVLLSPSPPANTPGVTALPAIPTEFARSVPSDREVRARFLATSPDQDVLPVSKRLRPESPQALNDRYLLRIEVNPAAVAIPGLCLEAGLDTHDRHPPGQDKAVADLFGFSHIALENQPHCMMYGEEWEISANIILTWYNERFNVA